MTRVERLGDDGIDDRIAEELEALVVGASRLGVLVEVAAMDERLLEDGEVADGEAEAACQLLGRSHRERRAFDSRATVPYDACSSM